MTPPPVVPPVGGLFDGGAPAPTPPVGGAIGDPPVAPAPDPTPPPGGIFGGGAGSGRTPFASSATSPLNLIGKVESWGIGPATPVKEVTIKVSAATGAQLKELLKKLPDGMTFELSLDKEGS